jgi:signal transduction histidine kinase
MVLPQPTEQPDPLSLAADADLETVLSAWNVATLRLEKTHEALRCEVSRLSDELEIKNRELARKNRLADLGQIASHIAHEVRNNLVPVSLYLSLLERQLSEDAGSLEVLGKVENGFRSLETTVGDLLNFASDRAPMRNMIPIHHEIAEIFASLAPQMQAQGIETSIHAEASLRVWSDPDMLKSALLNLVLNALDALPEGGQLEFTACDSGAGIELELADSGPGFPKIAPERLFEPFFTTKQGGTGLGLATVQRIVEVHGGHAIAMNCPEGGAAVTLFFPHPVSMEAAA